jgi:hypothetical protein
VKGTKAMNVESKLWKVRSLNGYQIAIVQKASGMLRVFSRSALPSIDALAAMSETRFDSLVRKAYHGD